MSTPEVIQITEANFPLQVLEHSRQQVVVLSFSADWCIPCRGLDHALWQLANEAGHIFRLARLDVDAQPRLAKQLGAAKVPAVKAFRNGQVVAEFQGHPGEARLREFVAALGPSTQDIEVGRAEHLLAQHEWDAAEVTLRQVLDTNPDHPAALLGVAKSQIARGDFAGALPILRNFPVSKLYTQAEQLAALAQAMADAANGELSEDALSPLFANSLRLVGRGQIAAGMDGLLELLRQNKRYAGGQAHRAALGLLSLWSEEDPEGRAYRKELAGLLF
ncbi:MAG: tetratricopeptide repeat protein [Anaerolineales bacterium]|nr:tetratricopeptide repeat protein [Anaerolineales bacterium]